MARIMSIDSPLMRGLSKTADFVILNFFFIITCLPVFTVGAALCSVYAVLFKISNKKEGRIVKSFFEEFKINFKKGVLLGLLYLGAAAIIAVNFNFVYRQEVSGFIAFIIIVLGIAAMLFSMVSIYSFALQSRFENTIKNTIKNSLLMSVKHLPKTFILLLINVVPLILFLNNPAYLVYAFPVFLLIGFSLLYYLNVLVFNKIFVHYIPEDKAGEENADIV